MAKKNDNLTLINKDETVELVIVRRKKSGKGGYDFNSVSTTIKGVGTIYSCSLVEYKDKKTKEDKIFLSLPSRKGSDDNYYSYIALEDWIKDAIDELINDNLEDIQEYLA